MMSSGRAAPGMLSGHPMMMAGLLLAFGACGDHGTQSPGPPPPPPPSPPPLSGRLLHMFAPGTVGFYYGPPTLVGDHIYIGTSRGVNYPVYAGNAFYKLTLALVKVWEHPLGSKEVRGGATLDSQGNIYFVVEEGRTPGNTSNASLSLYSIDSNGAFRWSKPVLTHDPMVGMENPAIAVDNTIYVGGRELYAFAVDGQLKWSHLVGGFIINAPIIDPAGNIYLQAVGSIVSVTPTGTRRWTFATSGEYLSSPAFSADYSSVFVAVHDKVYRLRSSTGEKLWEFTPPGMTGEFRATPAVDAGDNVYLGTKADTQSVFYAIKADGSGLLWQNPVGGDLYSSPALGDDGTLYVGSESARQLHALDLRNGAEKWSTPLLGDATWSSPVIAPGGTLYIASIDVQGKGGALYAFRTDAGGLMPNAGSPRFHEGNASTGRRQ
ncbi:MAG: PQQ-binding-like beta-propeller repeat protein [Gemmatimonadota bacterium]